MSYQVLYRAYRPSDFKDVVGQDYIVKTLQNAIAKEKIAHAYLFCGPRGTGKTSVAKIFAKAINCEHYQEEACGTCDSCQAFLNNTHPDIIELDAASNNSVEDIREIVDKAGFAPILGKYKVYIIDEVHMLSGSAFNALLKTLEEPPAHVIFILATTDPQKVIPTVLSRCQRYNFAKVSPFSMKKRLEEILQKEKIEYEQEALDVIISMADGGMRDALSILDQCLAYENDGLKLKDIEKIYGLSSTKEKINLIKSIHNEDISIGIQKLRTMYAEGIDIKRLCVDMIEIIKETILFCSEGDEELLYRIKPSDARELHEAVSLECLFEDIDHLMEVITRQRQNQSLIFYLELAFIKMAKPQNHVVKNVVVQKEEKGVATPVVKEEKECKEKPEEIKIEKIDTTQKPMEEVVIPSMNGASETSEPEKKEVEQAIIEEEEKQESFKEEVETIEKPVTKSNFFDDLEEKENKNEPETEELPEEVKLPEPVEEIKVESVEVDKYFLLSILLRANREEKVNDSILYNRLELYKLEPEKRKFYQALHNTELFASSDDAIIICANEVQKAKINNGVMNEELYDFLNQEFGIDKMCYGIDNEMKKELIAMFRGARQNPEAYPEVLDQKVIKYQKEKKVIQTTEEHLRELFGQVKVEEE